MYYYGDILVQWSIILIGMVHYGWIFYGPVWYGILIDAYIKICNYCNSLWTVDRWVQIMYNTFMNEDES